VNERVILSVAAVLALAACAKPAAPPMNFERPPAPVQVAVASGRDVAVYIDAIGRAVAKETVWVKAQVEGRIEEARFEDGADLKKGDVLFVLDARPFEARLASAEASLLRARAALARAQTAVLRPAASLDRAKAARDLARAEFQRVEGLVATKAVSQADFDNKKSTLDMMEAEVGQAQADVKQAEPEVAAAEADVKKAESDVATARLDVEYCTIRSPIDGRAGHRLVDAGNLVASMASPLVLVERLDPVYVDFTVPENDVTAVQRNMAKGALRVEARLPDAAADETRAGTLTFLDNAIAQGSGTLSLRATLPNSDHHFWPGRFVKVRLILEPLPSAVLVPAGAPQLSGKGTFVYVVKDDGTAEMRFVELGQRQGELVVVKSGVKSGERVVVVGQLAVTPGGKVRIEETAAPAAPAAAAAPETKK
jgi:multidrug efflux system membrane fusion protein